MTPLGAIWTGVSFALSVKAPTSSRTASSGVRGWKGEVSGIETGRIRPRTRGAGYQAGTTSEAVTVRSSSADGDEPAKTGSVGGGGGIRTHGGY